MALTNETQLIIMNTCGWLGLITAQLFFISPSTLFINLIRGKSKLETIPWMIIVTNLCNCSLWFTYSSMLISPRFQVFLSSSSGTTINLIYLAIYLTFLVNKNKTRAFGLFSLVLLCLIFVASAFHFTETFLEVNFDDKDKGFVAGKFAMVFNTLIFISPAQKMVKAYKTGNSKLIPIHVTLCGFVNAISWFIYAYLKPEGIDFNNLVPNVVGIFFSVMTILIWIVITCKGEGDDFKKENLIDNENKENDDNENKENDISKVKVEDNNRSTMATSDLNFNTTIDTNNNIDNCSTFITVDKDKDGDSSYVYGKEESSNLV